MMKSFLVAVPCAALLACASPDDIRQRPVVWSASYPAAYDLMANCVAVESMSFAKAATPLINAKEGRAEVLIYGSPYGNMLAQFGFREMGDGTTAVEYRDFFARNRMAAGNAADKLLSQCSRGA